MALVIVMFICLGLPVCFQSMVANLHGTQGSQLSTIRITMTLMFGFFFSPSHFIEGICLRKLSGKYMVKLLFIAHKFYKLYLGEPNAEMCLAIALLSSISVKNNYRIQHQRKMPTF